MFKQLTKITLAAFAVMLLLVDFAWAQNFTNNAGGTYNANCEAVIRMRDNNGQFDGGATALGDPAGVNAIPGTVDWTDADPGQTVQARLYENLFLSGGTKTVENGVIITGNGCTTPLAGYLQLDEANFVGFFATSGARTYSGDLIYRSDENQRIFAENSTTGTGDYTNLSLEGAGQKVVATGEEVGLTGTLAMIASNTGGLLINGTLNGGTDITQDAAAPIEVDAGSFTTGTGTNQFNGDIDINGTGTLTNNVALANNYAGIVNVNDGSFAIDDAGANTSIAAAGQLNLTAVAGTIDMTNDATIDVAGAFTNTVAAGGRTNMNFSAASTVTYSGTGAQTLVAADATNKYGNLVFSGAGVKTADGDNYVQDGSTVTVGGGEVDMVNGTGGPFVFDVDATSGNVISYTSANNDDFILGSVRLSGTIDPAIDYTLNNAQTQVSFGSVPTDFTLDIRPNTAPTETNNFDNTTDVNRSVTLGFNGGTNPTLDRLRVGYTTGDLVAFTGNEDELRFAEAYDAGQDYQKVTGGSGIATNSGNADPRFVNLLSSGGMELIADGSAPGTAQQIANNSQILLTSTPLIYIAVNDGRWTNDATWDEGVIPPSNGNSNVEIRALVYVGIDGPAYGTGVAGNETSEASIYAGPATNSITIPAGTGFGLIIGNEDNGGGYVFQTALSGTLSGIGAGFYNNNPGVNTGDWNNETTDPATSNLFGLYVTNPTAGFNNNIPIFGTAQITNAGNITNEAIIELGN